MNLSKTAGLLAAALVGFSLPQSASAQFVVGNEYSLKYQGFMAPEWTLDFNFGGSNVNGISGGSPFQFDLASLRLDTFCIDFEHALPAVGSMVDYTATNLADYASYVGNTTRQTLLERLYGHVFGGAYVNEASALVTSYNPSQLNESERAAFQFAVWEITYDSTPFNLGGGNFSLDAVQPWFAIRPVQGAQYSHALSLAGSFLSAIQSSGTQLELLVLDSETYQDQIYVIPEPGTYAAILAGVSLVAVMIIRRRRRTLVA